MHELTPEQQERQNRSVERAKSVSQALSEAARRARFSSRARGAYIGTTTMQRRAGVTRLIKILLLILIVIIPNVLSVSYYGFIASNQYETVTTFTVSSGAIPKMDDLGSATGLPPIEILQDTVIAISYIESARLVRRLEDTIGLRQMFGSDKVDFVSRFNPSQPIEKLTVYWNKQISASASPQSGIVTLHVRAFSPAQAQEIAAAVVAECETMVNQLNDRMYKDTIAASERDLDLASDQLKLARVDYAKARNAAGIVSVSETSKNLGLLLTQLQGQLLKAQSDYKTQSAYLSPKAPQLRILNDKIASLNDQVNDLKAKITTSQQDNGDKALSQKLGTFADLDLEQNIAEKRYAEATASLNMMRITSERKMLYLHQIVPPALPEQSGYPHRRINMTVIFICSLLLWTLLANLVSFFRNRFR